MGNYPTQQIAEISGDFVGSTVSCLKDLSKMGIPKDDAELKMRIDGYFDFCASKNFRPGIESLCLALSTSRQNFWVWCNGGGNKSREWQQACLQAKQCIIAFLEACSLSGKINPAAAIFALKNWAGYSDSITIETGGIAEEKYVEVRNLPKFDDTEY